MRNFRIILLFILTAFNLASCARSQEQPDDASFQTEISFWEDVPVSDLQFEKRNKLFDKVHINNVHAKIKKLDIPRAYAEIDAENVSFWIKNVNTPIGNTSVFRGFTHQDLIDCGETISDGKSCHKFNKWIIEGQKIGVIEGARHICFIKFYPARGINIFEGLLLSKTSKQAITFAGARKDNGLDWKEVALQVDKTITLSPNK